jgi:hypothetical protein
MAESKFGEYGFAVLRVYLMPSETLTKPYLLQYKIDSGANVTTITHKRLNDTGYDDAWIKKGLLLVGDERPSVATGVYVENCFKVVVPEIRIGTWVGRNWPFVVNMNEGADFRLLFGTDSMQFFKWVFDYESGVFRYEAIVGKTAPIFGQQDQSIHSVDEVGA